MGGRERKVVIVQRKKAGGGETVKTSPTRASTGVKREKRGKPKVAKLT